MKYVLRGMLVLSCMLGANVVLRDIELTDPFYVLSQMDTETLFCMFWYVVIFELPRYTLGFIAVGVLSAAKIFSRTPAKAKEPDNWKVSCVIAGHNEAESIRKCIRSLGEQTRPPDEIIVIDDGSTDGMREVLGQLIRDKKITAGFCNQVRCGKAAACNLGMSIATGDIIINLDADCSYDYDSIELLLRPFTDPEVGAACGNIGVRNSHESSVSSWQAIEYSISINLGKRVLDFLEIVTCASGAFGAFRATALRQIGINEPGPGEDFDITMRLRRAGWKIRFVGEAWCMTDVPATAAGLIRQRRRWDRDTIRIRMRKFRDVFNPRKGYWNNQELLEQTDFITFNLLTTLTFPVYLGWLFYEFGSAAWVLLIAVSIVYVGVDALAFLLGFFVSRRRSRPSTLSLFWFVFTFGVYNGYFMRAVRLYAYFEEWLFRISYKDSYVPRRVLNISSFY